VSLTATDSASRIDGALVQARCRRQRRDEAADRDTIREARLRGCSTTTRAGREKEPWGEMMGADRDKLARLANVVFYAGLAVLLGLILADVLRDLIPVRIARRIGYNSEGYLFALIIGAWIQFVLPRLTPARRWPVTIAGAVVGAGIGFSLLGSDLPSQFKTLNEPFISLGLVLPYLALRRPLGRYVILIPVLVLIGVVLAMNTDPDGLAVDLAETYGYWLLVPIAFDLADRGILDPEAVTSKAVRYSTYAVMIVLPTTVSLLGVEERSGGGIHAWLSYLGRVHESFIGVVLLMLFFAVGHGRTGRSKSDVREAELSGAGPQSPR
jgi:hypothetical protein